jgi:hypothetical protein
MMDNSGEIKEVRGDEKSVNAVKSVWGFFNSSVSMS